MKYKKQALSLILGLLIISLVLTACTPTPSAEPETTVASVPATTLPAEITISPTASTETTVPPTVSTETPPTTPTHVENSGFYLHNANIQTRFGTAQYTVAEIRAMKDYSASELQAAISTVADMIQYIVETDYGDNSMFIGGVSLIYTTTYGQ